MLQKKIGFILLGVFVLLVSTVYFVFNHKNSLASNQTISINSSISSLNNSRQTDSEVKANIVISLQAISSALETKDVENFNRYVDAKGVCTSVINVLYKSFEQYMGSEAKAGIIASCSKDMLTHVQASETQISPNSPLISLKELTENPDSMSITQNGDRVVTTLKNQNGQTSFGFRSQDSRFIWDELFLGGLIQ